MPDVQRKENITDAKAERYRAKPSRYLVWDTGVPGLALAVEKSGTKTWLEQA